MNTDSVTMEQSPRMPTGATDEASAERGVDAAGSAPAGNSLAMSIIAGALIAVSLVATRVFAAEPFTPAFLGTLGFLVLTAQQDVRRRKIPNWLTGTGLLLALGHAAIVGGWAGLGAALLGAGIPFVILMAAYAGGLMGAGDVKALMALGALWGAWMVADLLVWSIVIGGVIGFLIVAFKGELGVYFRRWWGMIRFFFNTARINYIPPSTGEVAAGGLPFGLAIGLALAAHQIWGGPFQ